jgi:hypothetical protein
MSSLLAGTPVQTKYNQVIHDIEIYLDNSNGASLDSRFNINPNAIVNLTIEDTLADWVTRGTITFMYTPDSAGELFNSSTGQADSTTTGVEKNSKFFYNFRNDGNDILRIKITPNVKQTNSQLANAESVPEITISDPIFWTISHVFSIYDAEDIDLPPGAQNQASASLKCIKLYFWDYIYQKLATTTIEYSTALSEFADIEGDIASGKYDNPGAIPTGIAMREIINKCLDPQKSTPVKSYSLPDPSLNMPYPFPADIGEEWEEGQTKMFYTAPANITAYESLNYVHRHHVSQAVGGAIAPAVSAPRGGTQGTSICDISILIKEKGPTQPSDQGYLTLRPISHFFENAGKAPNGPLSYQIEHFFVQGYTSNNRATKEYRAPILTESGSDTVDIKSLKYNQITNFRFVDMSALTNSQSFCNTPVYSFDFKNRNFNIEFTENLVTAARDFMSKKYIDQLYKRGQAQDLFLITLDSDKLNNNVTPVFSLLGDDRQARQAQGLHKLLYMGLFHNTAINFRTLGLSFREPGRFIGIDRTEGVEEGIFEDKFYGQWFVINVKHVFESEIYYNDITAVKLHRFQRPSQGFSGII